MTERRDHDEDEDDGDDIDWMEEKYCNLLEGGRHDEIMKKKGGSSRTEVYDHDVVDVDDVDVVDVDDIVVTVGARRSCNK